MKKTFSLLLVMLLPIMLLAQKPTINEIKNIAKKVYKSEIGKIPTLNSIIPISDDGQKDTLLFITQYKGGGFAIVSNSKSTTSILGFSQKGEFDLMKLPPGLFVLN